MRKAIIGILALTCLVAGGAQASTRETGCAPAFNLIDTTHGLSQYLRGIGTSAWRAPAPTVAVTIPACGPADLVLSVSQRTASQSRFFALLRTFPRKPTAKQWKGKYMPLVTQAIKADQATEQVVATYMADAQAQFNALYHCGQPPNQPGLCDNDQLYQPPVAPNLSVIAADLATLQVMATLKLPQV